MTDPSRTTVFEMAGLDGDDPLGLWTPALSHVEGPAPADPALHFGVGDQPPSAPPPDVPVYRVRLPDDPSAAEQALAAQEERIRLSERALDAVPGRLEAFIERQQAAALPRAGGEPVAFGTEAVPPPETRRVEPVETGPEAELLGLLEQAEATELPPSTDLVQFGIVDEALSPALREAQEKFNALMEQIKREVLHFAWVETGSGSDTLARSTVGWSGDTATVWLEGAARAQAEMHKRSLRYAVASRALKVRMGFVITTGASKIAILLTTPGTQALALPVVYRFVTQVLAQVREYQALNSQS